MNKDGAADRQGKHDSSSAGSLVNKRKWQTGAGAPIYEAHNDLLLKITY